MHSVDSAAPVTLVCMEPERVLRIRNAFSLPPGNVHLWAMSLPDQTSARDRCEGTLSLEERVRANRFVLAEDRSRFILAHGLMRHLLGLYLGCAPGEVEFRPDPMGKPELADAGSGISFNLSHSSCRAVLAIGRGQALGIDVEHERGDVDVLELADSCLFRSERDAVRLALPERRRAVFFRYWVAKESVLKGEGLGLGFPLDKLEVVFSRNFLRATVRSFDLGRLQCDWNLRLLSLGEGWPVAISGRGENWQAFRPCMDNV
jgi:4'-phosphopantetheinyl transferase